MRLKEYEVLISLSDLRRKYKSGIYPCMHCSSTDNFILVGYCAIDKNNNLLAVCNYPHNWIKDIMFDFCDKVFMRNLSNGYVCFKSPNPRVNLVWTNNYSTFVSSLEEEYLE